MPLKILKSMKDFLKFENIFAQVTTITARQWWPSVTWSILPQSARLKSEKYRLNTSTSTSTISPSPPTTPKTTTNAAHPSPLSWWLSWLPSSGKRPALSFTSSAKTNSLHRIRNRPTKTTSRSHGTACAAQPASQRRCSSTPSATLASPTFSTPVSTRSPSASMPTIPASL